MTKQSIRAEIARKRAALTPAQRQQKSDAALHHLTQSSTYQRAGCVFTFLSIRSEIDTHKLLQLAWAQGKTVAVPLTAPEGQMDFVRILPNTTLHKTKFGTLEPARDTQNIIYPSADDLFLVPGLAFDLQGNRYGYGGGFYDRYLAQHPHTRPVAFAFALQISPVPLDFQPHDVPMTALVSEGGWIDLPASSV